MSSGLRSLLFVACCLALAPNALATVFTFSIWATVSPVSGWSIEAGDYTGDGRLDVMVYHPSNGSIFVGRNTGSSTFVWTQWATVSPASGWSFTSGDFNNDGRVDISGYHPSNGSVWVGRNSGASTFVFAQWAIVSPASGWSFTSGDFNGDGRLDLSAYFSGNGSVWVGSNSGANTFTFAQWATVGPAADWSFQPGDYTRDGRLDLVGYHPSNGTLWVGRNTGSATFEFKNWGDLAPDAGWRIIPGRFAGDSNIDVMLYDSGTGQLLLARNAATTFWIPAEAWETVMPANSWSFVSGDFDNDGRIDVAGYHPSNGTVWVGKNNGIKPEGYVWPLSAAPGDSLSFHISGVGSTTAYFERHDGNTAIAMGSTTYTPAIRSIPVEAWRNGAGWPVSFSWTIPANWPSGLYSARLVSSLRQDTYVTFIVKPAPGAKSSVAVLANINTWLAYNFWGGRGKYSGAARTSFLRPMPDTAPVGESFANHHQTRAEKWVLGWLEDEGYDPDLYTDLDFHNGVITGYDKLVITTHPEYWSTQMYDNLVAYLNGGGSVVYVGGNGIYEAGVYLADQTGMTFVGGVEFGPREPYLFRMIGKPERSVLGVATEGCDVPGSPFGVEEPAHWVFNGTSILSAYGANGLNIGGGRFNGAASAWETDTSSGPGAVGLGCSGPVMAPSSTLPAGLVVLARGTGDRGGEITYYDHPGGGFVFAAGSITFGGSLVVDANLQQMMRNVMNHP